MVKVSLKNVDSSNSSESLGMIRKPSFNVQKSPSMTNIPKQAGDNALHRHNKYSDEQIEAIAEDPAESNSQESRGSLFKKDMTKPEKIGCRPIIGELDMKSSSDSVQSNRSLQNARPNEQFLDPRQQIIGSNLVLNGGTQPGFRLSRQLRSMSRCKTDG